MTIKIIDKAEYPIYLQQFQETVREIFPILCFQTDEIEKFIKNFEPQYDDIIYLIENEKEQKAYSRISINSAEDRIIGSCYGRMWGNEMSVEELAILPNFYDRGLGRYLAIRCMQELNNNFGQPNKYFYFFIETNRTWTRALKFYKSLGFEIDEIKTDATLYSLG